MIFSPYDPILLFVLGAFMAYLYKKKLYDINKDSLFFSYGLVIVFWINSVVATFYQVEPWLMMPSSQSTGSIAFFYMLAYPFWYKLGAGTVFTLIGKKPSQGGLLWVLTIEDETEDFEPSWEE